MPIFSCLVTRDSPEKKDKVWPKASQPPSRQGADDDDVNVKIDGALSSL